MRQDEFTYPQPWWVEGRSWLFLFTRYTNGRELYWSTSPDGRTWAPAQRLATGGHYQMSNERDGRVITGFNAHPDAWNVDARTNLYFLQTADGGRT